MHEALRGILSHWPSAATANSSKEVLLLHEIEMLTEHADQSALVPPYHPASVSGSCCAPHFPTNIVTPAGEFQADAELRDLLVGTIVDSFQGCGPKQLAQSAHHTAHDTQHYSYLERCNGRSAIFCLLHLCWPRLSHTIHQLVGCAGPRTFVWLSERFLCFVPMQCRPTTVTQIGRYIVF